VGVAVKRDLEDVLEAAGEPGGGLLRRGDGDEDEDDEDQQAGG
jgi:hypothetical protein